MITRAEVVEVFEDKLRVRIPLFDNIPKARQYVPDADLSIASVLVVPGVEIQYKKGDIVFVGFENNMIGNPVVLGYLKSALNKNDERNIIINASNVTVSERFDAPIDSTIGEISYRSLKDCVDNSEV